MKIEKLTIEYQITRSIRPYESVKAGVIVEMSEASLASDASNITTKADIAALLAKLGNIVDRDVESKATDILSRGPITANK